MDWIFLSFIAMLGTAVYTLFNQYHKQSGLHLAVWIKTILAVITLPMMIFIGFPDDWRFYALVALTAPLGMWGDKVSFDVASDYGGGVVSRIMPIHVIIIFILWALVQPDIILGYFTPPLQGVIILLSLGGIIYFSNRMRRCTVSYDALKKTLPAVICFGIVPILSKSALEMVEFTQGVIGYICIQSIVTTFIGMPMLYHRKSKTNEPIISPSLLKLSGLITIALGIHMATKNAAYTLTDDPTFPVAIIMTSPFFILLFYKLTGHTESGRIWTGLGIVMSAIILVLAKGL